VQKVLAGKGEGNGLLGRPRRRWEDSIKWRILKKLDGGLDWIDLAKDRNRWRVLVNAVKDFRVP
jgi:hypothetical protein